MRLVRAALQSPYTVVVGVLVLIVLGWNAATRWPADLLPIFKTPAGWAALPVKVFMLLAVPGFGSLRTRGTPPA